MMLECVNSSQECVHWEVFRISTSSVFFYVMHHEVCNGYNRASIVLFVLLIYPMCQIQRHPVQKYSGGCSAALCSNISINLASLFTLL
jgi:hypothetical protein